MDCNLVKGWNKVSVTAVETSPNVFVYTAVCTPITPDDMVTRPANGTFVTVNSFGFTSDNMFSKVSVIKL